MAKSTNPKNAGGRPRHYTPQQVSDVIDKLIAEGLCTEEINSTSVKPRLCADHAVSDGIREDSLDGIVGDLLKARAEEERRALLKRLPSSVAPAVDSVVDAMKHELLVLIGRQNAVCAAAAETECEELRADKKTAFWRITELESLVREQGAELETLAAQRDASLADLAAAHEQLRAAQSELERRGREVTAVEQLLAELRNPAVREDIRTVLAEITGAQTAAKQAS